MQVLVVLDAQAGGLDKAGQVDGDHHAQAQVHVALHQAEHGQAAQHHRAAHQQTGKEIQGPQRHLAVPGLVAQGHQQSGGGQAQPEGGGQGAGDRQPGHRHQKQQRQQGQAAQQAVQQRRVVAAVHEGSADAAGADDRQHQAAHLQLRQPGADQRVAGQDAGRKQHQAGQGEQEAGVVTVADAAAHQRHQAVIDGQRQHHAEQQPIECEQRVVAERRRQGAQVDGVDQAAARIDPPVEHLGFPGGQVDQIDRGAVHEALAGPGGAVTVVAGQEEFTVEVVAGPLHQGKAALIAQFVLHRDADPPGVVAQAQPFHEPRGGFEAALEIAGGDRLQAQGAFRVGQVFRIDGEACVVGQAADHIGGRRRRLDGGRQQHQQGRQPAQPGRGP